MSDATKIVLELGTKTRTRRWERCGACLLYLPRRPYHRPRVKKAPGCLRAVFVPDGWLSIYCTDAHHRHAVGW
jgi:hypothetical protein